MCALLVLAGAGCSKFSSGGVCLVFFFCHFGAVDASRVLVLFVVVLRSNDGLFLASSKGVFFTPLITNTRVDFVSAQRASVVVALKAPPPHTHPAPCPTCLVKQRPHPHREKSDPFAVENLDSNNVLEAEIAAIVPKAATGDLPAVMRKGALETKLLASTFTHVYIGYYIMRS